MEIAEYVPTDKYHPGRKIPVDRVRLISRRVGTSEVYLGGDGFVYKVAPKFNIDNEEYFYRALIHWDHIPSDFERLDVELIRMEYIPPQPITDLDEWWSYYDAIVHELLASGIHHGDLTEYSVLVRRNMPVIIDFAESRVLGSEIPPKRPGPDSYWLRQAMKKIAKDGGKHE